MTPWDAVACSKALCQARAQARPSIVGLWRLRQDAAWLQALEILQAQFIPESMSAVRKLVNAMKSPALRRIPLNSIEFH